MADAGMLIGWNRVVAGQDIKAVELWSEMVQYLMRLKAEGHITSFEPVLLGAYGGSLNGFVLLHGPQDHLDRVRNSEDFQLLNVRANKVLDGFLVVRAHFGSDAARLLQLYATA